MIYTTGCLKWRSGHSLKDMSAQTWNLIKKNHWSNAFLHSGAVKETLINTVVLFFHLYTPFSCITSTHVVFYQIVYHSKLLHLAEVSLEQVFEGHAVYLSNPKGCLFMSFKKGFEWCHRGKSWLWEVCTKTSWRASLLHDILGQSWFRPGLTMGPSHLHWEAVFYWLELLSRQGTSLWL